MRLDPDPKTYCPNDASTNTDPDPIPTLFTKYIFWDHLRVDCDDKGVKIGQSYDKDNENEGFSIEDVTVEELDRALGVKEETQDSKSQLIEPIQSKLKDEQFPRILFLGTSAAGSFPLRNSSGILVHLS